ncbi:MAG: YigZ family protein [Paludibacter sp.]|nr:YigZ family protein [Paludibacter sp.]
MTDTYKTIIAFSEGIYKEKGSKFLAFSMPVSSVEEIKEIVKNYKKEYYDARHVCYAYMLGSERKEFRANDDGEPSGTAGRPILGQINSRDLTNILVIVVRYFGGILLGTGGLTSAYKEAASDALNHAEIVEKTVDEILTINFNYELMNDVMRVIKETNAQILHNFYENNCKLQLSVRQNESDLLKMKLEKIVGILIEN